VAVTNFRRGALTWCHEDQRAMTVQSSVIVILALVRDKDGEESYVRQKAERAGVFSSNCAHSSISTMLSLSSTQPQFL
jgi:hypothetical protein